MIKPVAVTVAAFSGFLLLTTMLGSWYTVDQGYRGVILRNGAVAGTAQPGLGFKMPWIDTVLDVSVQERVSRYGDDTSGLASYSRDQQPAIIRVSVNWRIPVDRVVDVYASYGGEEGLIERILTPRVYQVTKNVFGQYNAVTAIQERSKLNTDILQALQNSVGDAPILVSGVQIENIDFSEAYENSIEQRMLAEVEVQKLRQNAEREKVQAQIIVIQAQANADAVVARAKAEADATRLRGQAEGDAIRAKGQALNENPALVQLITAEKWNGSLPITMPPNGTVPFLNVAKGE